MCPSTLVASAITPPSLVTRAHSSNTVGAASKLLMPRFDTMRSKLREAKGSRAPSATATATFGSA